MTIIDTPPPPRHKEIAPLTGIRSLAALWVFLYHTRTEMNRAFPDFSWIIEGLTRCGYLGVDLFFTLSGFILAYNYGDAFTQLNGRRYLRFLWLRLARIYPVHFFVLMLFLAAVLTANTMKIPLTMPEFFNPVDFVKNLFLVQAWSAPVRPSWNTLAWSVSCEWLAYILLPICLILFRNLRTPLHVLIYLILSLGLVVLPPILGFSTTYSYGTLRIAIEFNLGIITYFLYNRGFMRNISWNLILPLLISALFLIPFLTVGRQIPVFVLAPIFGVVILGIAYERNHLSYFLSQRPLVYGGYISYSFYMIHELVLLVARKAYIRIPSNFQAWLEPFWPLGLLAMTLVCAILIYHFVEEHSRHFMRNLIPGLRSDSNSK